MLVKTKRVEIEYSRGVVFFLRLPLIGQVCWTHGSGWVYDTPSDVRAADAAWRATRAHTSRTEA